MVSNCLAKEKKKKEVFSHVNVHVRLANFPKSSLINLFITRMGAFIGVVMGKVTSFICVPYLSCEINNFVISIKLVVNLSGYT